MSCTCRQNRKGAGACWDVDRNNDRNHQDAWRYFADIKQGKHCNTDWYEQSPTSLLPLSLLPRAPGAQEMRR